MSLVDYIPPVLVSPLLQASEHLKFMSFNGKNTLRQNLPLKDTGKGKRAFLLATGPSIKMEDLSVLAGEDCFSLSNFFLHEDTKRIKPKFHFFAPYHEPLVLENFVDWLKQADATLPPETNLFLGYSDQKLVEEHKLFTNRKIHYLHFSNTPYSTGKVDITKPVLSPISGPLMIIPVLIYMGYKEIYLLGCDHTVMRDYKKTITHFYDKEKDKRKNASDVNSWEGIINSHKYSLQVFLQYDFYRKILSANGDQQKIINLSQDTWLDFFELNSLSNILS